MTSPNDSPNLLVGLRLLVVDDEPELLEILDAWFSGFGATVHTAGDGFAAVAVAERTPLDVVVTDLKMPGMDGLALLAALKDRHPTLPVIFLTGTGTMDDAIAALREGRAFDFLQKPIKNLARLNEVVLRAMARREKLLASPSVRVPTSLPPHLEVLSARELDILSLLGQGMDNRAIAEKLCNSEKTIKNHLTRIYEKLKVKNRTQAILICQQHGLL